MDNTEKTKPGYNKNILLAVTMTAAFFNPFMGAAVNIALPKIAEDLAMSAISETWVAMSFLLASAIFLVPFGKIADIVGRRKIFLYGNIIFVCATILCGFSSSHEMLNIARFIQGIGSALVFGTSMAIVISAFPVHERGKVIGLNVTAVYIGLTAAPMLGGVLTELLGWRSLFFLNAVAGIFIVLAIIFKIKAEWSDAKGEKFDFTGSLIYMVSIFLLMYGFSEIPGKTAILLTIIGLAGLVVFIFVELKTKFPVLNIGLFKNNRVFAFSNLAALINYAATFGITFILSNYLQYAKGLKPHQAGLILMTQPLLMAIVASFSGRLSDKYDSGILASIGMAIIVVGLLIMVFLDVSTSYALIITAMVILGFGFGLFSSPNTNSVMSSVEKKNLGIASATIGTMRLTGQMTSMAIAALSVNLFLGDAVLGSENVSDFMSSARLVFIVFTVLCFLGVFASLARGKKKNNNKISQTRN